MNTTNQTKKKSFNPLVTDALFCAWANAQYDDDISVQEKYAVYGAVAAIYSHVIMLDEFE